MNDSNQESHSPRRAPRQGDYRRGGPRERQQRSGPRGGADRSGRPDRPRSGYRPGQSARPTEPDIDADVAPEMLDREARRRLRTLSKPNADHVARHLVMAGRLIDLDSQQAYEHARAAVRHAGRVDVVREAMALTAYATARYAEAIREIRALRRLSGRNELRAVEADCERGLGRPERALAIVAETPAAGLPGQEWVELQLVASGARADLGEHETGLLIVDEALHRVQDPGLRQRLLSVRADRLTELGRTAEAAEVRKQLPESADSATDDTIVVTDLSPPDMDGAPEAERRERGVHTSRDA